MTTYTEVGEERDVAAFLARQLHVLNIWSLPKTAWVARQDGEIVAVLALTCVEYPALHFFIAKPGDRPFMRLLKLWRLAQTWLRAHRVPVICAPVFAHLRHYQSLLRRAGWERWGEVSDADGNVVEVIYAYTFTHEEPQHDSIH